LVPVKKPKVHTAAAKAKKSAPALPTAKELGSGEESGSDYGSENE
jgi:hypothetical protein